jgi:protein-tyrosine phosphatase
MQDLGATQVVLTPHFYPGKETIENFDKKRKEACKLLVDEISKKGKEFPKLHLGCEVYLEPIIFNNEDLTPLTLDLGGRFILIELLYNDALTSATEAMLRRLIYSYNLIPVLAHIDRYPFLMKEKNLVELLDMGCIAQINLSSLTRFFHRKKLLNYLKKGYIGAVGSDVHNKSYIPNVKSGLSYLREADLEYVTDISKGILKKVKKDSDNINNEILAD